VPKTSRDMKKDCGKPGCPNDHRSQHGQNKADQRDHRANLADSVIRQTRIEFSVQTARR
jgi:hypothetical protein